MIKKICLNSTAQTPVWIKLEKFYIISIRPDRIPKDHTKWTILWTSVLILWATIKWFINEICVEMLKQYSSV